jgi:nucleoside-diphosphate-sugar epimerase
VKIAVLGGTRFVGRALVEELVAVGHELLVIHRGESEPPDLPPVEHVHVERREVAAVRAALGAFGPDALVDTYALTRADAEDALSALTEDRRLLVLSSMDVYRAYQAFQSGGEADPVPLNEDSPVRAERYPYRGKMPHLPGADDYEKLDVEGAYRRRGATVCRLPLVYGEHDGQRREEFILRRVRAGRPRIPFGAGTWLGSRGYVRDVAAGIRLALESDAAAGEVLNLCETRTRSTRGWARQILEAAGSGAELVRVDEAALPADLRLIGSPSQHLLADAAKARALLGWAPGDPADNVRRSVRWHLEHPPEQPDPDFGPDDRALATAGA